MLCADRQYAFRRVNRYSEGGTPAKQEKKEMMKKT